MTMVGVGSDWAAAAEIRKGARHIASLVERVMCRSLWRKWFEGCAKPIVPAHGRRRPKANCGESQLTGAGAIGSNRAGRALGKGGDARRTFRNKDMRHRWPWSFTWHGY